LARAGRRVLLVDLDPQACLSFSAGLDPDSLTLSIHDVLIGRNKLDDVLVSVADLALAPATIDLAGAEQHLLGRTGRDFALREAIADAVDEFDFILFDCAPSLGVLTVNALTAATQVIIPLQCEALSHRGVAQLLDTISEVRKYTNPNLVVRGVVATMYDARTRHSREVLDDVQQRFGLAVLGPPVPKSVRFAEAPLRGMTILDHAPNSPGAHAYQQIANSLL
jgi:chromosome partitioning protein